MNSYEKRPISGKVHTKAPPLIFAFSLNSTISYFNVLIPLYRFQVFLLKHLLSLKCSTLLRTITESQACLVLALNFGLFKSTVSKKPVKNTKTNANLISRDANDYTKQSFSHIQCQLIKRAVKLIIFNIKFSANQAIIKEC